MVSEPVVFIENPVFDLAEKFILQTSRSLFLTGKAGTGKTTFLRKIKATTSKNTVVVAPTGVAAINAGGTTIHSFFQLPFTPFVPVRRTVHDRSLSDRYALLQNLRIESEKRNMIRELDLLIIDEVSMVRCDVLDAIDVVLRHFRRKEHLPFGGVQVLFIGDLFQLPPVAQQQEWMILQEFYESPFFFDAQVIREERPLYIELKTIFRQRDEKFIDILNRVRNNDIIPDDIEVLNKRFDPDFDAGDEKYITLTTHNYKADRINSEKLSALSDYERKFEAGVEGDFPERAFPTEKVLTLKEGAQIMFIKNDLERVRRYYNGKIGTISRIEGNHIFVVFPEEEGELEVEKDSWRNMKYTFNSASKNIEEEVVGTFTQYPVRLAWAITIHKSQGLTFERAIIDAGSAFASGQVYVALSRCTSLEGMVLKSRIFPQSIKTDERVLDFARGELSQDRLRPLLNIAKEQYIVEGLLKLFDFSVITDALNEFRELIDSRKHIDKEEAYAIVDKLLLCMRRFSEVSEKFSDQLHGLVLQQDFPAVKKRVSQGAAYFMDSFAKDVIGPLVEYQSRMKTNKKIRKYNKKLAELILLIGKYRELLVKADSIAESVGSTES
jgi:nucleoside-triphosphatase THEP1